MAHWKDAAVTNVGVEMLNEWMAGRKLTVTAAYGGTGTVDPEQLTEQTGLVDVRQTLSLMGQENDKTGVLVQVQVNNRGVTEEYELNQVAVYAALDRDRDPDSEEKCLFIMQDGNGVDVPTEDDEIFLLELYCAIGITNNGRFLVKVDDTGLVSLGRMREEIAAHNADPDAHGGAQAAVMDITIPAEGWGTAELEEGEAPDETEETGGLRVDIPLEGVTAAMVPWLSIYPADINTARMCAMSTTVRTLDGALRVYAQRAPDGEIRASLALLGSGGGSGGSSYVLPRATETTLGGVKIGSGLKVSSDGTASVDWTDMDESAVEAVAEKVTPTGEEVDQMLDEVFQPATPGTGE